MDTANRDGQGQQKNRFDVSLEDLQTFVAVAQQEGIGRAARHLHLSQPSVSARVRRLEEKLKVRLLERGERGTRLTDAGRELYEEALETLSGINDLLQRFHATGTDGDGTLNLSVTVLMAQTRLPCLLQAFRKLHSNIVVHVHEQSAVESTEALLGGRCALALITCDNTPDTLEHEVLLVDENAFVTSVRHPLARQPTATLAEALRHPVLLPRVRYPQLSPIYQAVESRGLEMRLAPEAEGVRHPLTLMTMAAAGLGVFPCARTLVPDEIGNAVAIVTLSDCVIPRRLGLAWVKGRRLSLAAKAFRTFMDAARAPDLRTWPDGDRATRLLKVRRAN